jgi:alpha-tubulin suppressor-like RCC1 family protein
VWCWGQNNFGQLGNPSVASQSSVPVRVQAISGAIGVVAHTLHSCALLSDRSVWCWGHNSGGESCDSPAQACTVPTMVKGL